MGLEEGMREGEGWGECPCVALGSELQRTGILAG